jgi:hypothetical protein
MKRKDGHCVVAMLPSSSQSPLNFRVDRSPASSTSYLRLPLCLHSRAVTVDAVFCVLIVFYSGTENRLHVTRPWRANVAKLKRLNFLKFNSALRCICFL